MGEDTQKAVRVLSRIKDYFLEAIDKFSKTVNDATKTLTESLKRIEKDLKSIELGGLPASEKSTSTSVITTVLAKRGEIMGPEDLWSLLTGKTVPQPAVAQQAPIPPSVTPTMIPEPPRGEVITPPVAIPPKAPEFEAQAPLPPTAVKQSLEAPTEVVTAPLPTIPGAVPAVTPTMEEASADQTSVSSLKSEMLKELKRLKKLMTGMT
ncbi:MAG: hypothetical protein QW327_06905 [Candidatus Odinarchaeota archaeon]